MLSEVLPRWSRLETVASLSRSRSGNSKCQGLLCLCFLASFCSLVCCSTARDCSEFALWLVLAEAFLLSFGRRYLIKMKILLECLILNWQNSVVIQNQDEAFGFGSVSCGDFITSFVLFYVMILFWCDLGAFSVCLSVLQNGSPSSWPLISALGDIEMCFPNSGQK